MILNLKLFLDRDFSPCATVLHVSFKCARVWVNSQKKGEKQYALLNTLINTSACVSPALCLCECVCVFHTLINTSAWVSPAEWAYKRYRIQCLHIHKTYDGPLRTSARSLRNNNAAANGKQALVRFASTSYCSCILVKRVQPSRRVVEQSARRQWLSWDLLKTRAFVDKPVYRQCFIEKAARK